MSKILIVAEKPDVARSLALALLGRKYEGIGPHRGRLSSGEEVSIVSGRGHLFELAPPEFYDPKYGRWNVRDIPIVPPPGPNGAKWNFTQIEREDGGRYLQILREQIAQHHGEEIVNACDAGREGEVIFRKIMRGCGARAESRYSRVWAQETTEEGLREAFANRAPSATRNGLGQAGFTRDEADWLIGMNVTVLAQKTLPRGRGKWKVWSVGRVQTPTLALVDARDRLIANFKPQPFWDAYGVFDGLEAKADLDAYAASADRPKLLGAPEVNTERDKKVFWSRAKAEAFAAAAKEPNAYDVAEKRSVRTSRPPLPLNLQEVQKLCSKQRGFTGTQTLGILQELYETRKLLSYPRTDSRHLPTKLRERIHGDLAGVVAHLKETQPALHLSSQPMTAAEIVAKSRAFDDSKISDHYGIVPTGKTDSIDGLTPDERFVFLTVLKATLMALDEPARFNVFTRTYTQKGAIGAYAPAVFKVTREEVEFPGYLRWEKPGKSEKKPPLGAIGGGPATLAEVQLRQSQTNPPDPYRDDTLLDAMLYAGESFDSEADPEQAEAMMDILKDKGIGTPATRAAIIDTLVERGFLERQGKNIVTTENGRLLIRELGKRVPEFLSAKLTAEWELVLKQMEQGTAALNRIQFLDALLERIVAMKEAFIKTTQRVLDEGESVPITDGTPVEGAMCPKSGQPMLDRGPFFEAAGWPGVRLWKRAFGREFAAAEYVELLTQVHAGKVHHAKALKSGTGREYEADIGIDAEAKKLCLVLPEPKKVKGVKCPKTGKLLLDHGIYFAAAGWPNVRLYKNAFGRTFTAEDYVPILDGWHQGAPIAVGGLVSAKSGKTYSAKLVVDPESNKVRLDFGPKEPPSSSGASSSPAEAASSPATETALPPPAPPLPASPPPAPPTLSGD
ncbi:MAG TPA: DNA topoisomerase [Opitutaceae bacterium]|nr:DNA topoisomerase [Opitutaceae bacterium]